MIESIPRLGETYALLTAVCWTVTAMSFESAGKKVGSLSVNILRLLVALVFFSIYGYFARGLALPLDATPFVWKWLGVSALVGFCLGDLLLFQAFVMVGSRISMLIMSGVPPLTALLGWWIMGEKLTLMAWFGMFLTLCGICIVILSKGAQNKTHKMPLKRWVWGLIFASGGGIGQAVGLVLSKYGMGDYDALAATHIRVIVGAVGFGIIFTLTRRWNEVFRSLRHRTAMKGILLGSFFGPFLGVSFSLLAIQNTDTGIASTIMAIVPVLIIPPAIMLFKEKVTKPEIFGAFLAVIGVAVLFL